MADVPTSFSWSPGGASVLPSPTYANGLEIVLSQWDFTFYFSHLFGARQPGTEGQPPQVVSQDVARIVMSPQHAKAALKVLQGHVDGYEQVNGPIPDLLRPTEAEGGNP